ncbi:hypothetical protein ABH926_003415 [Catenulispora sp. GP43]
MSVTCISSPSRRWNSTVAVRSWQHSGRQPVRAIQRVGTTTNVASTYR